MLDEIILSATMKWSGLGLPPLEPCPSQYAGPLPSITWPEAPVMRTFVPVISIGLKSLSAVEAKVVVPANVTVVPDFSLVRSRTSLEGIARLSNTMFVHDATADEI